jgi:hypothetical protein
MEIEDKSTTTGGLIHGLELTPQGGLMLVFLGLLMLTTIHSAFAVTGELLLNGHCIRSSECFRLPVAIKDDSSGSS